MQSITLWIQFIIFFMRVAVVGRTNGICSNLRSFQFQFQLAKLLGHGICRALRKARSDAKFYIFLPGKSSALAWRFFFLNLLFGYKLRSLTLVALQAYGWILPRLVWSIFASFRYRFDTCPEPTCAAQSHHYSMFFWRFWNLSNSVSQTNVGSKKSAKSTW